MVNAVRQTKALLSSFHSKDGRLYDTYEAMRLANIRYNEQRLKAKGLDNFPKLTVTVANKAGAPQRQAKASRKTLPAVNAPRRSSRRVRNASPTHMGLADDADIDRIVVSKTAKPKQHRRTNTSSETLSDADRTALRQQLDWIDGMDQYLENVQQISGPNRRSVMRQVEKLASGKGVTYHHWEEGTYFAAGRPITLGETFSKLYEEACAFENEHGRDLGNGTFSWQGQQSNSLCLESHWPPHRNRLVIAPSDQETGRLSIVSHVQQKLMPSRHHRYLSTKHKSVACHNTILHGLLVSCLSTGISRSSFWIIRL
jgi:hypothetical protein